MLKRVRAYRVLRIGLALAWALPRYWILMARGLLGRPASPQAWNRAHEAAAEQIRRLAIALEGGLIKAAQIGGARADVLPRPFIEKLSQFHDNVPARPFETLAPVIEAELGAPVDEIFASVDRQPLGRACATAPTSSSRSSTQRPVASFRSI
jgi:ubiquinone biosynthesis protein